MQTAVREGLSRSHAPRGSENVAEKPRYVTAVLTERITSVATKRDHHGGGSAEPAGQSATCGNPRNLPVDRRGKCIDFPSSRGTAKGQRTRPPWFTGNRLRSWC